MARPSGAGSLAGMAYALICAICSAVGTLTVRGLTRTESSASIVFYTALFMTLGTLPVLPVYWVTPSLLGLALFCSIGLIGGISQYWTTVALYHAPAAALSPFNYTALIWGSVLGFVIWGEVPTTPVIIGSAIVTLTGLYLLRHEAFRRRPRHPAPRTRPAA
jgi:drug/metabolite transporter (DMT)-like permease